MKIDKKNWKKVKFEDVVTYKKVTVNPETSGLDRYIAGDHMTTEDLHLRRWGTVGDGYLGPAFHSKFEKGDILYGSRRTYLKKVAVADFDGITSNTTFVLKEKTDKVVPGLIPLMMLSDSFTEHSVKNSKGSVNPYINFKDIGKFEFLLPPKEQQAKLAELLWAGDSLIEDELILKKSLRNCLVTLVSNTILNNNSKEYKKIQLSEIIEKLDAGVSVNSETGELKENDKGILMTSCVSYGYFNPNEIKKVKANELNRLKTSVKGNSIIISRMNTVDLVGANAFVKNDMPNIYLPDRLWQTVISREDINVKYLWHILSSSEYRKKISSLCGGTSNSMKNISKYDLLNLFVHIPSLKKQNEILNKIERIEYSIKNMDEKLLKTKQIQKQLINQIFG